MSGAVRPEDAPTNQPFLGFVPGAIVGSVDATEAASASKRSLLLFNRFERFKNQRELTGATGACFKMLSHPEKHFVERHSVENALSVLVQFIKTFRASQLHFSRLSDHREQPVNLFRV
jgi:hypothetical protein